MSQFQIKGNASKRLLLSMSKPYDQIIHDLKFGLIKVLQCIEYSFFLCLSEISRRGGLE